MYHMIQIIEFIMGESVIFGKKKKKKMASTRESPQNGWEIGKFDKVNRA